MTKFSKSKISGNLPVYKIQGKLYFRDARLGEYRNVDNFMDTKRIDDVDNSDLEIPNEADKRR